MTQNLVIRYASNNQSDREVCGLSSHIALYTEMIMRKIDELDGFKIGGYIVNNLTYADDTVILTESEQQL